MNPAGLKWHFYSYKTSFYVQLFNSLFSIYSMWSHVTETNGSISKGWCNTGYAHPHPKSQQGLISQKIQLWYIKNETINRTWGREITRQERTYANG